MNKSCFFLFVLCTFLFYKPLSVSATNVSEILTPAALDTTVREAKGANELTYKDFYCKKNIVGLNLDFDDQIFITFNSVFYEDGKYGKVIENFVDWALSSDHSYFKIKGNADKITWALVEAANSCFNIGDYYLAEFFYNIALGSYRNSDNLRGILMVLNSIGLCRLGDGEYEDALFIFKMSDKIALKNKLNRFHLLSTIYISKTLAASGYYFEAVEALEHLTSDTNYLMPNNDMNLIIKSTLVELYVESGQVEKAIILSDSLRGNYLYSTTANCITKALLVLSKYYADHNEFAKAINLAKEAELKLNQNPNLDLKTVLCSLMYRLNKRKGDLGQALAYFEESERLQNINNNDSVRMLIWGYEKRIDQQALVFEKIRAEQYAYEAAYKQRNQKNLSLFLLAMSVLLVILVVFMKGFESRVDILLESIASYRVSQKILFYFFLAIYFALFFYFLLPVTELSSNQSYGCPRKLFSGIYVLGLTMIISYVGLYCYQHFWRKINKYNFYQLLSVFTFFCVVISLMFILFPAHELGFNTFISLSLVVFASYILPFFGIIIYVETIILKKYQAMSEIANLELMEIRQNLRPYDNIVEIQSEKTSAKLQFNINDLLAAEAQGNYCMFYFRSGDLVQRRIIHISLRLIENQLSEHGQIVRCHKSFMINIHRIVEVKGNSRGYLLYLHNDIEPIPISRSYQKKMIDLICRERNNLVCKTDY